MTIEEISEILHARILRGEQWKNHEVHSAYGCDLMGDVLAHSNDQDLLLTGLCNPQSIRTAEMMDFTCIVL